MKLTHARTDLVGVAAAATTLALTLLPTASTAAPARALDSRPGVTVTLQAVTPAVARFHQARLRGAVTGVPVGSTVKIWQHLASRTQWVYEGRTRIGASHTWRYHETVHTTTRYYRACVTSHRRQHCSKPRLVRVVPEVRYAVSAAVGQTSVAAGSSVTVSGHVTPGARGDRLQLWGALSGGTAQRIGKGKVGRHGHYALHATLPSAGAWSLHVVKPPTAVGARATSRHLTVTATKAAGALGVSGISTTTLQAGQPVTVTGTASPNLVGQTIYLQTYSGKQWGNIGSAGINSDGTWSVTGPLNAGGKSVPLQVTVPESAATLATTTGAPAVTVYAWYYLSDLGSVDSSWEGDGQVVIGGATYAHSVYADGYDWEQTSYQDFNLGYGCTQFQASIGLDDGSPSGSQALFQTVLDSVTATHGSKSLGSATTVTRDLTGGFRLRLEETYQSGGPIASWGDARILCAGAPQ